AKMVYPIRFQEFLRLIVTNKYFFVFGKNDPIYHPFNFLLFVPQAICIPLLLYKGIQWKYPEILLENPFLFVQLISGFVVFVLTKITLEKIVGITFNIENLVNQYVFQKLSYRNLMTALFFITLFILVYITPINKTIILVFCLVIGSLNAIALFYSYKTNGKLILSNFFYFILYLCALEISPYIILYKVFT
ncbi:MAG: hypothetical protein ACI849_001812, partial [Patiriisocius sp.]